MTRRQLNQLQIFIIALEPERWGQTSTNLPTKEKAIAKLREKSGQDFGDDPKEWAKWLAKNSRGWVKEWAKVWAKNISN